VVVYPTESKVTLINLARSEGVRAISSSRKEGRRRRELETVEGKRELKKNPTPSIRLGTFLSLFVLLFFLGSSLQHGEPLHLLYPFFDRARTKLSSKSRS